MFSEWQSDMRVWGRTLHQVSSARCTARRAASTATAGPASTPNSSRTATSSSTSIGWPVHGPSRCAGRVGPATRPTHHHRPGHAAAHATRPGATPHHDVGTRSAVARRHRVSGDRAGLAVPDAAAGGVRSHDPGVGPPCRTCALSCPWPPCTTADRPARGRGC